MTDPIYGDPLLQEAAQKISDIVDALPANLRFNTLYWVQFLRDVEETKHDASLAASDRQTILENKILDYARIKGRKWAEAHVNQNIALATLSQQDAVKQLALLYSYWNEFPDVVDNASEIKEVQKPKETPLFKHDCDRCIFLGCFESVFKRTEVEIYPNLLYDLYYCSNGDTVIARYGNDGPEYMSGLSSINTVPVLKEAKNRAIKAGYLKE